VQAALGDDCPIMPVLQQVSLPEEITSASSTVSATMGDLNKNFYVYYNRGVMAAVEGTRSLPATCSSWALEAVAAVQEAAK
jgi:hypothetical protein